MKSTILMLTVTFFAIGATAQSGKNKITAYGAGVSELTWVNGKPALNLGGYGGVLINHRLLIGAAGNNIFFKRTVNNKKESFQFNYYGLYSEYRFIPQNQVGVSIGLTGAMGWQENDVQSMQKTGRKDGDYTFVLQPKVGMNIGIVKFMQAQVYGSYRITGNTNSNYYTSKNHNGLSAGVGLVFGSF